MTDWKEIINAAHQATEKHGIPMRGRKYLQVQHRVEMFRLSFGEYGIETTLLHFGKLKGESIVVQAVVKDEEGRIISSGIAEEIRGQGAVNTTSAIENAETSAIGRALACLGLHGGEFASLNEMELATDRSVEENAKEAQTPPPPKPVAKVSAPEAEILDDLAKRAGSDRAAIFKALKIDGDSWADLPENLFTKVRDGMRNKLAEMEQAHDKAVKDDLGGDEIPDFGKDKP